MVKWTNAGGQTKRANERFFVYCPPAWRRWRNVKTTYNDILCPGSRKIFGILLTQGNTCSSVFYFNLTPIKWIGHRKDVSSFFFSFSLWPELWRFLLRKLLTQTETFQLDWNRMFPLTCKITNFTTPSKLQEIFQCKKYSTKPANNVVQTWRLSNLVKLTSRYYLCSE